MPYVENHSTLLQNFGVDPAITWIFPPHPTCGHATIIPDPNVHRSMEDQTNAIKDLQQSMRCMKLQLRSLRLQFLNSSTKTTVETFLGIFSFQGKKRTDFVNALVLPPWVKFWLSKEDLKKEVALRCIESADNTTHYVRGCDSVQTLLDAWQEDEISDESYKCLMLMNISIFKGYNSDEAPAVGGALVSLFEDKEALTKIVVEMLKDESWEIRANRPFRNPGGKTRRDRFIAEVKKGLQGAGE
jgi:hypothetical protein